MSKDAVRKWKSKSSDPVPKPEAEPKKDCKGADAETLSKCVRDLYYVAKQQTASVSELTENVTKLAESVSEYQIQTDEALSELRDRQTRMENYLMDKYGYTLDSVKKPAVRVSDTKSQPEPKPTLVKAPDLGSEPDPKPSPASDLTVSNQDTGGVERLYLPITEIKEPVPDGYYFQQAWRYKRRDGSWSSPYESILDADAYAEGADIRKVFVLARDHIPYLTREGYYVKDVDYK